MGSTAHLDLDKFTLDGDRLWTHRPFGVKVGRHVWSVSTSGYLIVAIRIADVFPISPPAAHITRVKEFLAAPLGPGVELNVEDLLKWAGKLPNEKILPGDVNDCHAGVLLGHVLDRRKLAWLLTYLGTESVFIWDPSERLGVSCIGFEWDSGKGRVLLAGLGRGPQEGDSVFEVSSPLDLVTDT